MNYGIKLNLAKLKNVRVANIKGNTCTKPCVIIPVEDNDIFISEKNGFYLEATAIEMKQQNYGQSHLIKRRVPKEKFNQMTDEEKKAQPIIGSLSPMKAQSAQVTETVEVVQGENMDDLSF